MSWNDTVNTILFNNPVSKNVWGGLSHLGKSVGILPKTKPVDIYKPPIMSASLTPLWKLAGHNLHFVRLAGLSGAAAVILGAYGAHKQLPHLPDVDLKKVFETANRFHFFHSLALLAMPIARRPFIVSNKTS